MQKRKMSKFYCVKVGHRPGIYRSWAETEKHVKGFSGAIHKSFSTKIEALNYLYDGNVPPEMLEEKSLIARSHETQHGEAIKLIPTIQPLSIKTEDEIELPMLGDKNELATKDRSCLEIKDRRMVIIYTDGSKRTSVNHRGSGCYCRFNDKDFGMSLPFTKELQIKYEIKDEDFDKLSSPTLEYLALAEVLWSFIQIKAEKFDILVVADYIGVKCWTDGSWKAEVDYVIKIRNVVKKIIDFLATKQINVKIRHVKGHSLIFGNELSDLYAKNVNYFTNLPELVKEISEKYH